jgi:hypothetical protein
MCFIVLCNTEYLAVRAELGHMQRLVCVCVYVYACMYVRTYVCPNSYPHPPPWSPCVLPFIVEARTISQSLELEPTFRVRLKWYH